MARAQELDSETAVCGWMREPLAFWLWHRLAGASNENRLAGVTTVEPIRFRTRLLAEEPVTLQDIGDQYGISRERIRQLESRVKTKLKDFLLREFKDATDRDVSFVNE